MTSWHAQCTGAAVSLQRPCHEVMKKNRRTQSSSAALYFFTPNGHDQHMNRCGVMLLVCQGRGLVWHAVRSAEYRSNALIRLAESRSSSLEASRPRTGFAPAAASINKHSSSLFYELATAPLQDFSFAAAPEICSQQTTYLQRRRTIICFLAQETSWTPSWLDRPKSDIFTHGSELVAGEQHIA